jgi:chromate transporter
LASGAVILLPVVLMLVAVAFLQRNKGNKDIDNIFSLLRKVVVGLIAAAALQLLTADSFGMPSLSLQFILSIAVFLAVFILSLRRTSPILLILASGVVGIIVYSFFPL